MKRQALDDLRAAIEANTEQRSLEDLRAEGKQNVRIVSGERVFQIITAIVHDLINREVGQITERDRDRIVSKTKQEFDRVLQMQSKQDGLLRGQKDLIEDYKRRLGRASKRLGDDGKLLEGLRETLRERELELERLRGERETLAAELSAARERSGESEDLNALRDEMTDMKTVLRVLEERSAKTEEALVERLSQREVDGARQMEERFADSLEEALDRITKTMEAATAKPIDVVVEATDVLIDKLFDSEDEMDTNLGQLDVEKRTSRSGISRNLDRLKALRAKEPDEEPKKKTKRRSTRGPDAQVEKVSDESSRKMKESMNRLRSVRGNAPEKGEE
jgi:chromosome segregation ATPase